ncbi:hypothetical protein WDU94_010842 [Cyamophila willieti]
MSSNKNETRLKPEIDEAHPSRISFASDLSHRVNIRFTLRRTRVLLVCSFYSLNALPCQCQHKECQTLLKETNEGNNNIAEQSGQMGSVAENSLPRLRRSPQQPQPKHQPQFSPIFPTNPSKLRWNQASSEGQMKSWDWAQPDAQAKFDMDSLHRERRESKGKWNDAREELLERVKRIKREPHPKPNRKPFEQIFSKSNGKMKVNLYRSKREANIQAKHGKSGHQKGGETTHKPVVTTPDFDKIPDTYRSIENSSELLDPPYDPLEKGETTTPDFDKIPDTYRSIENSSELLDPPYDPPEIEENPKEHKPEHHTESKSHEKGEHAHFEHKTEETTTKEKPEGRKWTQARKDARKQKIKNIYEWQREAGITGKQAIKLYYKMKKDVENGVTDHVDEICFRPPI